ncbi:MAG TPA: flagellar protein FlgN [Chloroflexota bacterium]|nr:flagellar protein FlgN [Chloroflexota bacterium]
MVSIDPGLGGVAHRLADLEAVLIPLVPVLEQLQHAQIEQRQVIVNGDLSAMVVVNTRIEETSARIALLEQRRQAIQSELEGELGVHGLRAVLKTARMVPAEDRARLGQLVVQVARVVRDLREQGQNNAALLEAAIGAASRTRQVLERLMGADTTYDPKKARRQQAAMRARASLVAATSVAAGDVLVPNGGTP